MIGGAVLPATPGLGDGGSAPKLCLRPYPQGGAKPKGKGNQAHAKNRKGNRDTFGIAEKLGGSRAKRSREGLQNIAQHSLDLSTELEIFSRVKAPG
jgi:hypothetical protein